jgi:hypothetical protein
VLSPGLVVVLLTVIGFVTAIISALLAYQANTDLADDIWLEVTKGAVQVIAVGAIGGALGYAWRSLATKRDAETRRRDKLRAELADLVTLYNGVKSIRRVLRSIGLGAGTGEFTDGQVEGFRTQMLALNDVQLEFEAKMRQFGEAGLLRTGGDQVVGDLHTIEDHLNNILSEAWEGLGPGIQTGSSIEPVTTALHGLLDKNAFRMHVSDPRSRITTAINEDVFGEASREAKSALAKADQNAGSNLSGPATADGN